LSFSTVAELLQDVLPVDTGLQQETVRQHGHGDRWTGSRRSSDRNNSCTTAAASRDIERSPEPGPPDHGGT